MAAAANTWHLDEPPRVVDARLWVSFANLVRHAVPDPFVIRALLQSAQELFGLGSEFNVTSRSFSLHISPLVETDDVWYRDMRVVISAGEDAHIVSWTWRIQTDATIGADPFTFPGESLAKFGVLFEFNPTQTDIGNAHTATTVRIRPEAAAKEFGTGKFSRNIVMRADASVFIVGNSIDPVTAEASSKSVDVEDIDAAPGLIDVNAASHTVSWMELQFSPRVAPVMANAPIGCAHKKKERRKGAVLTSTERLHASSTRRAKAGLQEGVLRGVINEGTPDARNVVIDLGAARGGFIATAQSSEPKGDAAEGAVGDHPWRSDQPRRGRGRGRRGRRGRGRRGRWRGRGRGLGYWWWYSPWWWWWWVAEGADASIEGSDGTTEALHGSVRVGVREDKSTEEEGDDDDAMPRFELGAIEIDIDSGTAPLRVTSIVMEDREEVATQQAIGRKWDDDTDDERYPRTLATANTRKPSDLFSFLRKWTNIPRDEAVALIRPQRQVATEWALTLRRATNSNVYEVSITLEGADPQLAFGDRKLYTILTMTRIDSLEGVLDTHGEFYYRDTLLSMTAGTGDGEKALELLDALASVDDRGYTSRVGWDLDLRGAKPMVKPAHTGAGRLVPRLRKRKKASDKATWTIYNLENLDNSNVFVSVQKEDRDKHPWAGLGESSKKYALSYVPPAGHLPTQNTQGVALIVTENTPYFFDGSAVPTDHPFYITTSPSGGAGDKKQEGRETDLLTKKSPTNELGHPTIGWAPRLKSGQKAWSHYYQCANHRFMGGQINITPRTRTTMMLTDSGALVQYDTRTGAVAVVPVEEEEEERVFDSLGSALKHLGMSIPSRPLFHVGSDIDTRQGGLSIAPITTEDAEAEDDENYAPAVITRNDGSLYCDHVHSVASIKTWLQKDMPEGSSQMCPMCT